MEGGGDTRAARPLRILMVAPTSFFADYGCHVRILEEVRALQARGRRVIVCTYHNGSDVDDLTTFRSIDVPWLRRSEVGSSRHKIYLDAALTIETLRRALAFRPDIIHGHLHEGALIGAFVGALLRTPVIFDYQGSLTEEMLDHTFIRPGGLRERFVRRLERMIERLPAAITPSGDAAVTYLLERGVPEERITLIPDGIDTCRMRPPEDETTRRRVREHLGIPQDARVVVYLGLLAEYQGTSLLLDAANWLIQRNSNLYFVIAGYPGADAYKRDAIERGIVDRVLFPGRVPYSSAPELLSVGDVAVAPKLSRTESNGKILNYMALGLPVIAFDTPANRAILGNLGQLVEPGDTQAFAEAIEQALCHPTRQSAELRARVVSEFSWEKRVLELEAVYARVLGHELRPASQQVPAPRAISGASVDDQR